MDCAIHFQKKKKRLSVLMLCYVTLLIVYASFLAVLYSRRNFGNTIIWYRIACCERIHCQSTIGSRQIQRSIMSKPTKVPAMRKGQPYGDWRKELKVWEATNTSLNVDKNIQSGTLFESLEGTARQTVLSELSVAELTADDGIQNITNTLDKFFLGDETQNAYNAIDELMVISVSLALQSKTL